MQSQFSETVHHRARARRAEPMPVHDHHPAAPRYERRALYESDAMRVVEMSARPRSDAIGPTEQQTLNVLALPLAGVFARHRGARQRVLATPDHGLLLAAGVPYRVSFPGALGDVCLMLAFPPAQLARLLPQAVARDGFDERLFDDHALLPPALMLGARRLHRQLLQRDLDDALATEEAVLGLLAGTLGAARRERDQADRPRARACGRSSVPRKPSRCGPKRPGRCSPWPMWRVCRPITWRTPSVARSARRCTSTCSGRVCRARSTVWSDRTTT
jgi:hypothetical protein